MPMVARVYERDELYERVWSKPMREVAKEYGVSDVALKKACRKLNVPTPPQGHWLRVAAGRDVVRVALPAVGPRDHTRIVKSWWREHDPIDPTPEASARADSARSVRIEVASTLAAPHPLVARSAKLLRKAKPDTDFVSSRRDGLDIRVAPGNVERALRIMDALLKALDELALPVEIARIDDDDPEASFATRVRIDDHWIKFSLHESVKPDRSQWQRASPEERWAPRRRPLIPTGCLRLTILNGERPRWRDHNRRRLEHNLNEFIPHLFIVSDWMTQKARIDEENRQRELTRQREWQEQLEREAEEEELRKQLLEDLGQWRLARDIREYVKSMRAGLAEASIQPTEDAPLTRYLQFALEHADSIDPVAGVVEATARTEL
jgi:hypothetical protein